MDQTGYNFSNDFQDLIIASLVRETERFTRFGDIFDPKFFNGLSASETAFALREYNKEHGRYPSFTVLGNYLFQRNYRKNPDFANELVEYIQKLSQLPMDDIDYVVDSTRLFARERALHVAIRDVIGAQTEGKEIDGGVIQLFEKAVAVGTDTQDIGLEIHRDIDKVIDKVTDFDYGVGTGYPLFDSLWKTGWPPGWLIVPLAPPKRYKTAFCLNLARNMTHPSIDSDVLYYTCEISEDLAFVRTLFNLTERDQDYLFENKEKFRKIAKDKVDALCSGHLLFKGYPARSTTLGQIKAHAKNAIKQTGMKPRAIVIDYADTVLPTVVPKGMPEHKMQAAVYTEARALGAELGCCVIMPDRCTADAVDKAVPNMRSFQGAFEKAGIVDVGIGICATEAEYLQDRLRFFIVLNRHGEQYGHFAGSIDPKIMKISINEKIEYDPEAAEEEENEKKHKRSGGYSKTKRRGTNREMADEIDRGDTKLRPTVSGNADPES